MHQKKRVFVCGLCKFRYPSDGFHLPERWIDLKVSMFVRQGGSNTTVLTLCPECSQRNGLRWGTPETLMQTLLEQMAEKPVASEV